MSDFHHPRPLPGAATLDRSRQLRLIGLVALLLLGLWAVVAIVRHLTAPVEQTPAAPPPGTFRATPAQLAQMKIETVRDGSAAGFVQATGTISVDEDHSTPIVLPFSGQIADVLVQAGQAVRRGQPLLKLASSDFVEARAALVTATAQAATAQAQLRTAQDNAKRQQAIYETAGGALKDYRQEQSDLLAAQATAASASGAVAAARGKLGTLAGTAIESGSGAQAVYAAPVSGVVVARDVAPGQYVGAGGDKPLMTIASLADVWLVAQLPESDAASVKVGDAVTVTTPAYPGRSFRAVVNNVAAALDPATHRLPVRATVANPDGALKPQMFASFAIQRAGHAATGVQVPSKAVIHEGDGTRVWLVAGPGGLLRAQSVTIGDSQGGFDTIVSGLKPGDRVVTAGALFVNEAGIGG
jgi:cobalt-zinc-cadmium efflux system membrane fusion protein